MTDIDLDSIDRAIGYAAEYGRRRGNDRGPDAHDEARQIEGTVSSARAALRRLREELPGMADAKRAAERAYDAHVTEPP